MSSGRSREASGSDLGSIFEKCNTFHTKTLFFEARGVPKWSQNDPQNASKIKLLGSVAGLGALAPLEIRPLSLLKAQEGAVERSDLKVHFGGHLCKPNVYRR